MIAHEQSFSFEKLKAKLEKIDWHTKETDDFPVYEQVAQLLYALDDKDKSGEVLNGLTVANLIEENHFHPLEDCSMDALQRRAKVYFRTFPRGCGPEGTSYAVSVYLLKTLLTAIDYCTIHLDEVVEAGIETREWLEGLHEKHKKDERFDYGVEQNVFWAIELYVMDYIKKGRVQEI